MSNSKFKVLKRTLISDIAEGKELELPESDLSIQTDTHIIQYEHVDEEDKVDKLPIHPGCYNLVSTMQGLKPAKFELRKYELLETIDNTSYILEEANKFFNRLHVYKELNREPRRAMMLYSVPGIGKCLHPDQEVIMYDGSLKKAKDVVTGDQLMGPDSFPRNVLSTTSGEDEMYEVIPVKGDSYKVNSEHVLSLRQSHRGKIVNISVKNWLNQSLPFKTDHKGYRSNYIDFKQNNYHEIPPYILGLWLGNGSTSKSELTTMDDVLESGGKGINTFINRLRDLEVFDNKHIPMSYKTASLSDRLELLAGLIDTDGHLINNCYEIVQKRKHISEDICFIARSLGFDAYMFDKVVNDTTYYWVFISGDINEIPVRLERKKAHSHLQCKDVTNTGIKEIKSLGRSDYNGFTLDGDHLFLLRDFTITHNSSAITKVCEVFLNKDPGTAVIIWDTSSIRSGDVSKFFLNSAEFDEKVTKFLFIIEDIGGGTTDDYHGPRGADSSLLNLLDGVGSPFKAVPTFIISTTNNPENSIEALLDRPGRFDRVVELKPPNKKECKDLLKFIGKLEELTEDDIKAAELASKSNFSIAHLQEVIVRSKLDDISILESTKQLVEHKKKFAAAFKAVKPSLGFGSRED